MIRKFANPYAKAALALAPSDEEASRLLADLERFVAAMEQVPQIAAMASNPAVPVEKKVAIVEEIGRSLAISNLALRLLRLLTQNYRLVHVGDVAGAVARMVKQRLGIVAAQVTSAVPLDPAQADRLRSVLEGALGKKVELEVTVEPDLLGGFVAQVGSRRYDVSLRGQLRRMAEEMASASA
ncbi:MAG: ATP synthase F1 subunit delta [Acidobacteria bacterium]|nr:MAG: ATP synthase F1 subunit delta [Acidobacteriota bacterium]REK03697.1 MAG: ATP synthase F1 subunit delta [Acidobacteriota bacterium]